MAADLPGGVARAFARWAALDVFDGDDGFDYRAGLAHVRVPTLLLSGVKDLLAPPASWAPVLGRFGGPVETQSVGLSTGARADYGHGDLILGRDAPDDVFPRVAAFLERVATRR